MKNYNYLIIGTVDVRANVVTELDGKFTYNFGARLSNVISDEVDEMISEGGRLNLATLISEASTLHGVVTDIKVYFTVGLVGKSFGTSNYKQYSKTVVTTTQKLTDEQKQELLNFLEHEFKYGYGKYLSDEQCFNCEWFWNRFKDYYDAPTDYITVYCTLHLWQEQNFKLNFVDNKTRHWYW